MERTISSCRGEFLVSVGRGESERTHPDRARRCTDTWRNLKCGSSCWRFFYLPFTIYHSLALIRYSQHGRSLIFNVVVVSRASCSEIVGEHDGALKVRIAAKPVAGAANRELQRLLAKNFKLPQNAVEIVSGANSKRKVVRIDGADKVALEQLILSK